MARKTTEKRERVFGEEVVMKEQYYLGNPTLPTPASQYEYTPTMIKTIKRSIEDIHYFAETFFTIIDAERKRVHLKLRPYQKRILNTMKNDNRVIMLTSRQIGKCVSYNTRITLRHKITRAIIDIEIGRFFNIQKNGGGKFIPTNSLKFLERYDCSKWQIKTNTGWNNIKSVNMTKKYIRYNLFFQSGKRLSCADEHILIDSNRKEILAASSLNKTIITEDGFDTVIRVEKTMDEENMFDFELSKTSNHLYYTNGILSHNTTLMTVYALWLANFHKDQLIIILANKEAMAKEIFGRIKLAYMELPNWLKEPVDGQWNEKSTKFTNGSRIITEATTKDAIRGHSAPSCIILDEFAFVDEAIAKPFWSTVMPTVSTSSTSKVFISSTPNGKHNQFYDLVQRAMKKKNEFKLEYVYWNEVPGRDQRWKQRTIDSELNGDAEMFEQEYECKFLGSHESAFPPEVFTFIEKSISEPVDVYYDGCFNVWKQPLSNRIYVMGVDVAEGIGKDASVIQVLDITHLDKIEQVAMYWSNTVDPTSFVPIILSVAKMYGNPVMAIERNGIGAEVCNRIYKDENYPRFVNFGLEKSRTNFRPGVLCSNNTKSPAVVNMKGWLTRGYLFIHDRRFLEELAHFQKKTNNRWAAETGFHDDIVMSMVWALCPLHRSIVENYFIVEAWTAERTPRVIHNKFHYKLDPSFVSENMVEKIADYPHTPAIIYGRAKYKLPTEGFDLNNATREELELMGWQVL